MYIRSLAVALLILLLVIGSAGAEDVKIMGLMETHEARSEVLSQNCLFEAKSENRVLENQ